MLKKNILLTAVLALLLIASSYMDLHVIGSYWMPILISLGGVILICSLIAISVKKDNNGYASFGILIKHFAIIISIATIVSAIFGIVHISMMDETQKYALIDKKIEKMIEINKNNDMNQKELANLDDTIEDRISKNYEPSSQVLNVIALFLVSFIISFIPAVLLKKNPPEV